MRETEIKRVRIREIKERVIEYYIVILRERERERGERERESKRDREERERDQ